MFVLTTTSQYRCQKYKNKFINKNLILTYLRGLEVAELKEEDMPMV